MKFKVTVFFPSSWGVSDDTNIVDIKKEGFTSKDYLEATLFDRACDMIFDRGVSWDYEEIEENN